MPFSPKRPLLVALSLAVLAIVVPTAGQAEPGLRALPDLPAATQAGPAARDWIAAHRLQDRAGQLCPTADADGDGALCAVMARIERFARPEADGLRIVRVRDLMADRAFWQSLPRAARIEIAAHDLLLLSTRPTPVPGQ